MVMATHDNQPPPPDWHIEPRCYHGAIVATGECPLCWVPPKVGDNIIVGQE